MSAIGKLCKEPKCPLTDEWIKKKQCIYAMEYYAAIKRRNLAICTEVDELGSCQVRQISQSKTSIIGSHSNVEFNKQNNRSQGKRGNNRTGSNQRGRHKRLLVIRNKLRVSGRERAGGEG